jgi:uncharacterized alpha-E superfamily protein
MLSRTADNLYWLGRYIERAENTARMLDVAHRSALISRQEVAEADWGSVLAISGTAQAFAGKHQRTDAAAVITWMVFDFDNLSSIAACLRRARENGRALRGSITSEMWESLNETWLVLQGKTYEDVIAGGTSPFFDWVKERSHLFRGVTFGTMLRDDCYHFLRLGTFLERADNTARLLDVKYHMLLPRPDAVGSMVDFYQWAALLRSVSALRAYKRLYREAVLPWRVAELLILREDMPRSLRASYREIDVLFGELRQRYHADYECFRLAGDIYGKLKYGRMDEIFQNGLHEFLTDFIRRTSNLGKQIADDFQLAA